ncbi:MAG: hypothetical protein ACREH9_14425 [Pseudomonadota bacterium]
MAEFITKAYVRFREFHKQRSRGQTMTEYALIMAAVAVVAYVAYQAMGSQIKTLANSVTTDLGGS